MATLPPAMPPDQTPDSVERQAPAAGAESTADTVEAARAALEAVEQAQEQLAEAMQDADIVIADLGVVADDLDEVRSAEDRADESGAALDAVSRVASEAARAVEIAQTAETLISRVNTVAEDVGHEAFAASDAAVAAADAARRAAEAVSSVGASGQSLLEALRDNTLDQEQITELVARTGDAVSAIDVVEQMTASSSQSAQQVASRIGEVSTAFDAATRLVEETVDATLAAQASHETAHEVASVAGEVAASAAEAASAGRIAGAKVAEAAAAVEEVAGDAEQAVLTVQAAGAAAAEALQMASESAAAALRAQEQIHAASQAKSEYIGHLNHELRTPMAGVVSLADLLLEGAFGDLNGEQVDAVRDMRAAGEHLLAVVGAVLDMSKIEAGMLELRRESVALQGLLDECVRQVRPLAGRGRLTLTMHCDGDLVVATDALRLKQMLLNLLSNAIKFTRAGGSVELDAAVDAEREVVVFRVTDTGIGMSAADIALALQPFGQVSAAQDGVAGTGLGLPIVNKLAIALGGAVEIDSVPGRGTTMRLVLPR